MIEEFGKYYLYRHIRMDKNEPFYIGIGTIKNINCFGICRYERANSLLRNKIWKDIVIKTSYEIEIIFETNNYNFLKEKEIEFISLYGRINLGTGTLANLTNGGDNPTIEVYTKEIREKISSSNKNRISPNKGKPVSKEMRARISNSLLGNKLSKDCIEKRTATLKKKAEERGFYHSESHKKAIGDANSKIVLQFTLDGIFIREFKSLVQAQEISGVDKNLIYKRCLNPKRRVCKTTKFLWKYK